MAAESSENRNLNEDKKRIFDEQNRELQTYLGKMDTTKEGDSETKALNHVLATRKDLDESSMNEWIIDTSASDHMTGYYTNISWPYEMMKNNTWEVVGMLEGIHFVGCK